MEEQSQDVAELIVGIYAGDQREHVDVLFAFQKGLPAEVSSFFRDVSKDRYEVCDVLVTFSIARTTEGHIFAKGHNIAKLLRHHALIHRV